MRLSEDRTDTVGVEDGENSPIYPYVKFRTIRFLYLTFVSVHSAQEMERKAFTSS